MAGKLLSGDAEEALDIGISFTGLLDDLDIDSSADDELKKRIGELRELESRMARYEDSFLRTKRASAELSQATRLKDQLRATREMIRVTKTIASMMGVRPKGSERALKVQDTRINYMILDELMAIRRIEYERGLSGRLRAANARLLVAQIKDEEKKTRER